MRRRGVVGRCECECECECEWCSGLDELDRESDEARERDKATGAGFDIGLRPCPVAVAEISLINSELC